MVGVQIFAGRGVQALPVQAGARFPRHDRMPEIAVGHFVVDIPPEIRVHREDPGLRTRVQCAGGDDAALVEGEGAKTAGAKAARQLVRRISLQRAGTPPCRRTWMPGPPVGQFIHLSISSGQGHGRGCWIKYLFPCCWHSRRPHRVVAPILQLERVLARTSKPTLKGGQLGIPFRRPRPVTQVPGIRESRGTRPSQGPGPPALRFVPPCRTSDPPLSMR